MLSLELPLPPDAPQLQTTEKKISSKLTRNIQYEWEHLHTLVSDRDSTVFSVAKEHPTKNRYQNVLPFDYNRVELSSDEYINASNISIQSKNFICCQAPLPDTFCEFWDMIFEKKTPIILMLTNLYENNKLKAHPYWPEEIGDYETYGEITVELDDMKVDPQFGTTKRYFSIFKSDQPEVFSVLHIQYTNWPDFGVPDDSKFMKELIDEVESGFQNYPLFPIVVHCSAGIGRTGTFLAIYSYFEYMRNGEEKSVQDIVTTLRTQRPGMVQTAQQYHFIHFCVKYLHL